jgi:hypothetical protein
MTCHPHVASGVLLRAMPCIMVADAFSRRGVGLVCAIGDFPIFDRRHRPLAAQAPVALGVVSGTLVQRYTCFTASARPLPLPLAASLHSDAFYLCFLNFHLEFCPFYLAPLTNPSVFTFHHSPFHHLLVFYC